MWGLSQTVLTGVAPTQLLLVPLQQGESWSLRSRLEAVASGQDSGIYVRTCLSCTCSYLAYCQWTTLSLLQELRVGVTFC